MSDENVILEVRRDAVADTRLQTEPTGEPADGEVRVTIERFALTANNVTYAVAGDMLGYWDFYPTELPWGRVPAMGWARVVESAHPDVAEGTRYYGWFPMARFVTTTVAPTGDGVRDDGPHRLAHAPVYRAWVETTKDPLYQEGTEAEDRHALLRGLFLTGYLIDATLGIEDYRGADTVLVTSASSKTSIAFAHTARQRGGLRVVGLTSARNADFVGGLDLYDDVVEYDAVDSLPSSASVLVDMAGNTSVVAAVHDRLGASLRASLIVGASHHNAATVDVERGPDREFFFAPTAVSELQATLGRAELDRQMATGLHGFVDASATWLGLDNPKGPEAVMAAWAELVAGTVPPSTGIVATMHAV